MHPTCPTCGSEEILAHPRTGTLPEGTLLPVHDPMFNFEQVCMECLLLEQHLFDVEKRCIDCIMKHLLTIEALLREIPSLDSERRHTHKALAYAAGTRGIRQRWRRYRNFPDTGQAIRHMRKVLMAYALPTEEL